MDETFDRHSLGSRPAPAAVALETRSVLHIPGEAVAVATTLLFDALDPAAVTIRFDSGGETSIEWLVSRDLLLDGLTAMTGVGDVVIWPGPRLSAETCNMRLTSPTGQAVFELSASHVRAFLDRTFDLVPRELEVYGEDLDVELQMLLEGHG